MKSPGTEIDPKQQALDREAAVIAVNNLFQNEKVSKIIEESKDDLNKYIQGGMKSKARLAWMGVKIFFRHPRTCLNIYNQRKDLIEARNFIGDTEFQKSLLTDANILGYIAKHSNVLESLIGTYKETDASKFLPDLSKKNLDELKIESQKILYEDELGKTSLSKEQLIEKLNETLLKETKARQGLVATTSPLITGLLNNKACIESLKNIIVKEELLELYNKEGTLKSTAKFMKALQSHGELKDILEKNATTISNIAKLQVGDKLQTRYGIHKDLLANGVGTIFQDTKNAEEILNSLNNLNNKTSNKNLMDKLWDGGSKIVNAVFLSQKTKNLFQDMQKKDPNTAKYLVQALAANNIIDKENKKAETLVTYFLGGKSAQHGNSLKNFFQNSFNKLSEQSKKITPRAAFDALMSTQCYSGLKALTRRSNAAIKNVEEKSITKKEMVEPDAELSPKNSPSVSKLVHDIESRKSSISEPEKELSPRNGRKPFVTEQKARRESFSEKIKDQQKDPSVARPR